VLLRHSGGAWQPQAIAPSFSKDQLRALGAPTNVTQADS